MPQRAAPDEGRVLRVTQVRSSIGVKPKHRGTLRALGLRRIGHTSDLPDRPEIRGMIARVPHLVSVEEKDKETKAGRARRAAHRSQARPEPARSGEAG